MPRTKERVHKPIEEMDPTDRKYTEAVSIAKDALKTAKDKLQEVTNSKAKQRRWLKTLEESIYQSRARTAEIDAQERLIDQLEEQRQRAKAVVEEAEANLRYHRARLHHLRNPNKGPKSNCTPMPKWVPECQEPDVPGLDAIEHWRKQIEQCFADYATMQVFPAPPPVVMCHELACRMNPLGLPTCCCNVKAVFTRLPELDLKTERRAWHPDRFSACPEQHREKFKKLAQEMFVIVDALYRPSS